MLQVRYYVIAGWVWPSCAGALARSRVFAHFQGDGGARYVRLSLVYFVSACLIFACPHSLCSLLLLMIFFFWVLCPNEPTNHPSLCRRLLGFICSSHVSILAPLLIFVDPTYRLLAASPSRLNIFWLYRVVVLRPKTLACPRFTYLRPLFLFALLRRQPGYYPPISNAPPTTTTINHPLSHPPCYHHHHHHHYHHT